MKLTERLFDIVFARWMRSRVRVHITGVPRHLPPDVPLLYCANHVSWWDGFLLRKLHRLIRPGAPFRAVMLEQELRTRPILSLLGGVGIDPGSLASGRRLLRTLSTAPAGVGVALFPQGAIRAEAVPPLGFKCGLTNIARALAPSIVLPVGIRMVPGTTHRMEALITVGDPRTVTATEPLEVQEAETAVVEELSTISSFLLRFGEDAVRMWPELHGGLPRRLPALLPLDPYTLSPCRN